MAYAGGRRSRHAIVRLTRPSKVSNIINFTDSEFLSSACRLRKTKASRVQMSTVIRSLKLTRKRISLTQCDRKQPCSACLERDDESNCKLSEKDIAPKLTYVRQNFDLCMIKPDTQAHPLHSLHPCLLRGLQGIHPPIRLCDRLQSIEATRNSRFPLDQSNRRRPGIHRPST